MSASMASWCTWIAMCSNSFAFSLARARTYVSAQHRMYHALSTIPVRQCRTCPTTAHRTTPVPDIA
eukprot:2984829-Rhodomonas_salina.3